MKQKLLKNVKVEIKKAQSLRTEPERVAARFRFFNLLDQWLKTKAKYYESKKMLKQMKRSQAAATDKITPHIGIYIS